MNIGYDIGRFTGVCAATGAALPPDTPCVAALLESQEGPGLERRDFSLAAWDAGRPPPGLFSWWRTVAPRPDAPRRLLVDDQALLDIVIRLEHDERPERKAFRFVLALVLLRRRLLRSVGREELDRAEFWLLQPRGAVEGAPPLRVQDPRLAEGDIAAIAEQLGEVIEEGTG